MTSVYHFSPPLLLNLRKAIHGFYKRNLEPVALLLLEALDAKLRAAQAARDFLGHKKDYYKVLEIREKSTLSPIFCHLKLCANNNIGDIL